MVSFSVVLLALFSLAKRGEGAVGESCDNDGAPTYLSLECVILGEDTIMSIEDSETPGTCLNYDGSTQCVVYAGQELHVTCCAPGAAAADDDLVLFRDGRNLGGHTAYWKFTTSLESGRYECRWRENGTSFANGSVVVDETVYVIPGKNQYSGNPFYQECEQKIVDNFNCSKATNYPVNQIVRDGGTTLRNVTFNVLGARPISLSLEILWVDHYPVDLDLSLSSDTALSDNISHTARIEFHNLALVREKKGTSSANTYLVVTGATSNYSSSMCVSVTFLGAATLLTNKSLPGDVTAIETEPAEFYCDIDATQEKFVTFTVAFLVKAPSSNVTVTCSNYTFSGPFFLNYRGEDAVCSGIVFLNSTPLHSVGDSRHLTARWPSVNLSLSGAEVVCALASRGITQWARTATLVVLPATPISTPYVLHTSLNSPHQSSIYLGLSALALIPVLLGGVALSALLVWWRYKRQSTPMNTPLAMSSLPSSVCSTPTMSTPQFPLLDKHFHFPSSAASWAKHYQFLQKSAESYSETMESDVNIDSLNATDGSSWSNELFYPPTYEVCVYVSYSGSQADWVQETLLPLLHSFQPIRVTEHEGHMIAGGVVSEERLRLLQSADKVVAVIAPDYQLTEWCNYELQHVLQQSSTAGAGLLIPILCGGCRVLPSTISTLHPLSLEDPNWTHKLKIAIRRQ